MEKNLEALTIVNIDSSDWKTCVGKATTYKCSLSFDLCQKLFELFESGDSEGLEDLKLEYPEIFDEDDNLDDFQGIFERHMVGDETVIYMENGDPITEEEYDNFLEDGFNHECGFMTISPLDLSENIFLELYGG